LLKINFVTIDKIKILLVNYRIVLKKIIKNFFSTNLFLSISNIYILNLGPLFQT
jgi:hypothetical protein